jgi:branched-chain amino acid transport system ATP-binding protein
LSYGQKRALEIGLALALHPRLLLLDEPTAGLSLEDVARVVEPIRRVARDRTVILVEHNMGVVAALSERITVLQRGRVLAEGTYAELRRNRDVIEAYLGGPA